MSAGLNILLNDNERKNSKVQIYYTGRVYVLIYFRNACCGKRAGYWKNYKTDLLYSFTAIPPHEWTLDGGGGGGGGGWSVRVELVPGRLGYGRLSSEGISWIYAGWSIMHALIAGTGTKWVMRCLGSYVSEGHIKVRPTS